MLGFTLVASKDVLFAVKDGVHEVTVALLAVVSVLELGLSLGPICMVEEQVFSSFGFSLKVEL